MSRIKNFFNFFSISNTSPDRKLYLNNPGFDITIESGFKSNDIANSNLNKALRIIKLISDRYYLVDNKIEIYQVGLNKRMKFKISDSREMEFLPKDIKDDITSFVINQLEFLTLYSYGSKSETSDTEPLLNYEYLEFIYTIYYGGSYHK